MPHRTLASTRAFVTITVASTLTTLTAIELVDHLPPASSHLVDIARTGGAMMIALAVVYGIARYVLGPAGFERRRAR
ncbi:MAG TPA: hypothetical protein VGM77_06005 [Gemmatimonadales bacterium]